MPQFSSLGSLDEKWLSELAFSMSSGFTNNKIPLGLGKPLIVWPTVEDVRCSLEVKKYSIDINYLQQLHAFLGILLTRLLFIYVEVFSFSTSQWIFDRCKSIIICVGYSMKNYSSVPSISCSKVAMEITIYNLDQIFRIILNHLYNFFK